MKDKFQNKYRIRSVRMQNWDYGWNAFYYVTICTGARECYFGTIEDKKVKLSEIGLIADQFWLKIPEHFHNVKLDEYIIMPNHIHGIIIIDNKNTENNVETPNLGVSNNLGVSIASKAPKDGKNSKWQPGVLGVIINQYKRICTLESRKINPGFSWQSRFYDHVIRDQRSLDNIRVYIRENPEKWNGDTLNPVKSSSNNR